MKNVFHWKYVSPAWRGSLRNEEKKKLLLLAPVISAKSVLQHVVLEIRHLWCRLCSCRCWSLAPQINILPPRSRILVFSRCVLNRWLFQKKKKKPCLCSKWSTLRPHTAAEGGCWTVLSVFTLQPIRNGGRHMGFSSVRVAARKHLLQLWSQSSSLREEVSRCAGLYKLKRVPHFCSARRLDSVCLMWKLECVSLVTGSACS